MTTQRDESGGMKTIRVLRLMAACVIAAPLLFYVYASSGERTAAAPVAQAAAAGPRPAPNPLRNAYFGDLHVHTSYSLDAYSFGTRNDPRVAYRYGRGEAVTIPGGYLDFMAVTDHDIWLGETSLCQDPTDAAYNTRICRDLRWSDQDPQSGRDSLFSSLQSYFDTPARHSTEICGNTEPGGQNKCLERARSMWQQIQRNADEFYQPGVFTTLIGFEWTAGFKRSGMLHRNVFFRDDHVPDTVLSAVELNNTPERLWQWLERACTGDCQVISIPHNTNWGWGEDFATNNSDGTPFTPEGLRLRAKTEPLVEIHQVKGDSECSTGLGTDDEQCNFEQLFKPCKASDEIFCARAADYVRNALKTGLLLEQEYGVNAFKYGFIGSTDTHSADPGSTDETNWHGAHSLTDSAAESRLDRGLVETLPIKEIAFNPGGLAAVWAEENTREATFDALKRRESFATSGTRIRVRFFAGWTYPDGLDKQRDVLEQAYRNGVPMGGDLPAPGDGAGAPRFVTWAVRDPSSAGLQKIQVIKGWAEGKQTFERVYDVACSDGGSPDAKTYRCPDNGAKVNLADCSYSGNKGAAELSMTWSDPDFNPSDRAFYYVRVLENPTCRWSTYDAHRLGIKLPDDVPATIQERAWSSPIWYTPKSQ